MAKKFVGKVHPKVDTLCKNFSGFDFKFFYWQEHIFDEVERALRDSKKYYVSGMWFVVSVDGDDLFFLIQGKAAYGDYVEQRALYFQKEEGARDAFSMKALLLIDRRNAA